jgi:phosphatidylglycerol:prolipoprotein diacylglycerol transferase
MNQWYFNPIMFQIGPFQAHWYGFMYALSAFFGYIYLKYSVLGKKISEKQKDTLLISVVLGIILGGRIGYILFYNLSYYFSHPLKIIAVWEGGMSFHGGLIGAAIALIWFNKINKLNFWELGDIVTGFAPVGLFLAKIGNFINAELYGRIATQYCLYFPTDPGNCRYPSQLLEALLEGIVLFGIVQLARKQNKNPGYISGIFLFFYGVFRIFIEFFREPDPQIGFLFSLITQGQLLSIFMVIAGILLYIHERKKHLAKN